MASLSASTMAGSSTAKCTIMLAIYYSFLLSYSMHNYIFYYNCATSSS